MTKNSASSFKKWIFFYFFLFTFIFLTIAIISLFFIQKISVEAEVDTKFKNIETILNNKIQSEAVSFRLFCDSIKNDSGFINSFKNKDVSSIQKALNYLFDKSDKDKKDFHFLCVDNKDIAIFRLNSNLRGDKVKNRIVLNKSKEIKSSYFYIETGQGVEADVRVCVPIIEDSVTIGHIIIGRSVTSVLNEVKDLVNLDFIFVGKKDKIDRATWITNHKNEAHEWNSYDTLVFCWSSIIDFEKHKFQDLNKKILSKKVIKFNINNKSYLSKSMTIKNFDESDFGYVLALTDNSVHLSELNKMIVKVMAVVFFNILILSFFLNKILNKTEKNLLTHERKLKEELKRRINLEKKLKSSNSDLKQLTIIATHNLRAPITSLEGLLDILREHSEYSEFANEVFDNTYNSVLQMKETLDSLTFIMHMRESFDNSTMQFSNLNEVTKIVLTKLQYKIEENNINIEFEISDDNLFLINENHLKSLLRNILSNAIKYSDPEKVSFIKIVSKEEVYKKVIIISDNGLGFDQIKHKGNIYKPFKKFHNHKDGTGIGLYMIKMIVDFYNGTILIESEVGVGTKITLKFKK